jgi:RNA polymerase sigma-70 factor (ECF subfamily)
MAFILRGQEKALEELYHRYHKKIYFYLIRMLNNDEEKAKDFLQDIFMKIIEKPDLFDPAKKFSTWLYAVAYNLCKNEYRRISTQRAFLQEEKMRHSDKTENSLYHAFDRRIDLNKFHNDLMRELEKFQEIYRHIFVLRFHENLTINQISEITGCKEGTVKSRLFNMSK